MVGVGDPLGGELQHEAVDCLDAAGLAVRGEPGHVLQQPLLLHELQEQTASLALYNVHTKVITTLQHSHFKV